MFRQLDYQDRVLSALDAFLDHLKEKKTRADRISALAAESPDLNLPIPDFAKEAWEAMRTEGNLPESRSLTPFSERRDGCNRPVPNAVLKVPTGGGKTWLAVAGVSRVMNRYLGRNHGFVLWIVPNEAIYTQTLKRLKDRQHPYRQALDRAAAGRVRILEKTDRLDARDVDANLCVMLLMLQSSNRENQEALKMFQDRGDVHGFFPSEGEQQAHRLVLDQTPNLNAYYPDTPFPMIKDSLGNALRLIRPVVVMDEGHRAIADLAFRTLYDFNPCFVLELTATPKDVPATTGARPRPARFANVLVEVTGRELDREGMIKMPLNLDPRQGNDWRNTLAVALERLRLLEADAGKLRADSNRYIRPIMLVQVERTGADQREGGHIHAEDVREWLLAAGFDGAEIAIKTAQQNDLSAPENQDLLSPTNRVRAIVTKQALQEGWDCPFAYVLCALAASTQQSAMTQLVGRILRQPAAMKTGIAALDECYIVTHHAETGQVVEAIKNGLEQDGLGDVVLRVGEGAGAGKIKTVRKIQRRRDFTRTDIYLPKVMILEGESVRELDYETDILAAIDWRGYDPKDIAERIPENAQAAENQLQRIRLSEDGKAFLAQESVAASGEILAFDPVHAVRMIADFVPNRFVGREILGKLLDRLHARGFDDERLGKLASLIVEELRKGLDAARNDLAEAFFKQEVEAGSIQFRLRLDGRNWRMPFSVETMAKEGERYLAGKTGAPLEKSLFAPVYESELNPDEQAVAQYLDGAQTLTWWHRNVARTQYGIQGWRKHKIYPDFIFAVEGKGRRKRITVLETKGDHLDNPDTAYKRDVLDFLSKDFTPKDAKRAGELELVLNEGASIEGTLILMSEWRAKLPNYL